MIGLDGIYLNGISADWVNGSDGYFYYTKDIQTGESIQFFESVSFPKNGQKDLLNKLVSLMSLQKQCRANFQPDFMKKEQPWGDTEIELCLHENDGSITSKRIPGTDGSITGCAGSADGFPIRKFLPKFDTLMPGDTVS